MNLIGKKLNTLQRKQKLFLVLLNDFIVAFSCWLVFGPPLASYIASEFSTEIFSIITSEWLSFLFPTLFAIGYLYFFGFYKSLIKFFDSKDSIFLSFSGSLIFGLSWSILHIYQFNIISTTFLAVAFLQGILLASVFYAFLNITRDFAKYILYPYDTNKDAKPIVIYGAGKTGNELYQTLLADQNIKIVGFFDESKHLKNLQINNIPILGEERDLVELKSLYPNLEVLLALPNIDIKTRRKIISFLQKIKVSVRSVPSLHELISDQKKMSDIQDLSIDDLLPRARLVKGGIKDAHEKTYLITGAGGSIGSEIVRQLLESNPKKLILLEMSEYSLFNIERECLAISDIKELNTEIVPVLGDIRDFKYLKNLFCNHKIDSIYHAAAYKHVPLVESKENISKAAENNILGTYFLAIVAKEFNASTFIMVSTDKAVRPTNVMGATKRFAEIIIQSLNETQSNTKFSMVRFGNVINSSGSVIPLFLDQISKGGPVTVTHRDVKRYFMTIPEASNLVLQAAEMSTGGEVFILDMGDQIKIYDLAEKLIHLSGRNISSDGGEGIEITEVGLRPGEKMYEELLISGDQLPTSNPKIFKSMESFPSYKSIEPSLENLKTAIMVNDYKKIIDTLKKNVEGYEA